MLRAHDQDRDQYRQSVSVIHQILGPRQPDARVRLTGVAGLQCRIRQDPYGHRGWRMEVLEYVQTFTEVGGNRRFDDRAIRLAIRPRITGQLTNLRRRTPSTGSRPFIVME